MPADNPARRRPVVGIVGPCSAGKSTLTRALLEHETLDQPEAYAAAGMAVPEAATPTVEPALTGAA